MNKLYHHTMWVIGAKGKKEALFEDAMACIRGNDGSITFDLILPGTNFNIINSNIDYESCCFDFTANKPASELAGYFYDRITGITLVMSYWFYDETGSIEDDIIEFGDEEYLDEFFSEIEGEE